MSKQDNLSLPQGAPPEAPDPKAELDMPPSIVTRTGNYASGTVDNGYAQSFHRNGVGESARGRPLDRDHHSELTNIDGGGNTVSSVGYVKLDGQQYNVNVTQFRQDGVTESTYVGIAPSSDPMNNIVTLSSGLNDLSPKMKALADAALSANGKGGTALTYEEAKGILVEGLRSPARPVSQPQEPEVPGAKR